MKTLASRVFLTSAAAAALAGFLAAHGLEIEVRRHAPAIVLKAAYHAAEPAAFAVVKIYAPGSSPAAYQSGNADASGLFAFIPDREGEWRVVVDDELGHRGERSIPISRDFIEGGAVAPGEADAADLPLWLRAVVGLALIFGASGVLYGFKARRRSGR